MNKFERDENIAFIKKGMDDNYDKITKLKDEIKKIEAANDKLSKQLEELQNTPYSSADMKIVEITDGYIKFNNNYVITYSHVPDCCEDNYADFKQLKDTGIENYSFKFIEFERVKNSGFRFGDDRVKVFVPCYSDQNGYYSDDLDIYLNDKRVLSLDGLGSSDDCYC